MSKLLKDFIDLEWVDEKDKAIAINDLCLDSRAVTAGDAFFACQGVSDNGNCYIEQAISQGAATIFSDSNPKTTYDKPIIYQPQLRSKLAGIAEKFYDMSQLSTAIIGVTGTNGKSSICHFIAQIAEALSVKTAIMGTLGNGFWGDLVPSRLTTADVFSISKELAQYDKKAAKIVAMEVSSHALVQDRVACVPFHTAVFTNLTRDHLDYHQDMASYAAAKFQLFHYPTLKHAVVNLDSDYAEQLINQLPSHIKVTGYAMQSSLDSLVNRDRVHHYINVQSVQSTLARSELSIETEFGDFDLELPLGGRFNIENCLAAIAALTTLDISASAMIKVLHKLQSVAGRFSVIADENKPTVIVDYAHTPDALENVLKAAQQSCSGQLICVFGCGGDRDRGKRPQMAAVAEQFADKIIVTSDNPRTESPGKIIQDIFTGFKKTESIYKEPDRAQAIKQAVDFADKLDVIVIAGKGHETYQEINHERTYFCDKAVSEQILKEYESCS